MRICLIIIIIIIIICMYGYVGDGLYMLGNTWHIHVMLPLEGVYGEVCTCISCFNIIHGQLLLNCLTQGDRFRMSGDAVGVCCHLHCCHQTVKNVRDYYKVVRRF